MSDDTVIPIRGGEHSAQAVRENPSWSVPVQNVIDGVPVEDLVEVLVLGRTKGGRLFMAATHSDARAALMLTHGQWSLGKQLLLESEE